MKRFMSIVALVAMPMFCAAFTANPDDELVKYQVKPGSATSGGRFQLFQGLHTYVINDSVLTDPVVFKIDSSTGKVWQFHEGKSKDGQMLRIWLPINQ